jgi:hypothetical protein
MTSVPLRTYLFLEDIYLKAEDETKDETEALGIMDIVWNLLSAEEQAFLDSRGYISDKGK